MPGLLDFLSEKVGLLNRVGPLGSITPTNLREYGLQRALTALNDQAQGASRGISADLLGGPVDMVSQLMTVPRYLGAPTPDFTRSPVGGSQWIGQKLESMGLLRPQTGSVDETAGRVVGGLLSTPQVVGAVGGAVEGGLLQAARNATVRGPSDNRFGRQLGMLRTENGQMPTNASDVEKLSDRFEKLLSQEGIYYSLDKSRVSPARYFHVDLPNGDSKKIRISEHRNVHGADVSVDPNGGATFEEMLSYLRKQGIPLKARVIPDRSLQTKFTNKSNELLSLGDNSLYKVVKQYKPELSQPDRLALIDQLTKEIWALNDTTKQGIKKEHLQRLFDIQSGKF